MTSLDIGLVRQRHALAGAADLDCKPSVFPDAGYDRAQLHLVARFDLLIALTRHNPTRYYFSESGYMARGMEWVELQWTDTGDLGPDQPDYIALHGEKRVARVYSHGTVMSGTKWQWFVWWYAVPNSGITDSRREAFLEVERLYNEHLQQAERSPPS